MPSILARLRRRVHDRPTLPAGNPQDSDRPSPDPIPPTLRVYAPTLQDDTPASLIDRPIVKNIATLLESTTITAPNAIPPGLKPPRMRQRTCNGELPDSLLNESPASSIYQSQDVLSPNSDKDGQTSGSPADGAASFVGTRQQSGVSQLASISAWSTFGRSKRLSSPILAEDGFAELVRDPHDVEFCTARQSLNNTEDAPQISGPPSRSTKHHETIVYASSEVLSGRSVLPSPRRESSETTFNDRPPSPSPTSRMSSHKIAAPQPSTDPRPLTSHSSQSVASVCSVPANELYNVAGPELEPDTPRTFGYHSRFRRRISTTSGRRPSLNLTSPSPPLPPVRHPELSSGARSSSRSGERSSSADARRSRSNSTTQRRSSAEWCARQAAAGSTSQLPNEYGWPAEVTQRFLRLSEEALAGNGTVRRGERPGDAGPRVTHRVPPQSETPSPCCRSSPGIPPLQPSPQSLQPSASLAATESQSYSSWPPTLIPGLIQQELLEAEDNKMSEPADAAHALEQGVGGFSRGSARRKPRSKRASHLSTSVPVPSTSRVQETSPFPTVVSPTPSAPSTPKARPRSALKPARSASEPGRSPVIEAPTNSTGKRKAEDIDLTPPDARSYHATFVIPEEGQRAHDVAEPSRAPSSYHRKRARLSSSPSSSPAHSRPGSTYRASWPSRNSGPPAALSHAQAASLASNRTDSAVGHDRRRSVSEISIPISALIAPRAPSMTTSSIYHMHDPRKPPKIMPTEWSLRFKTQDEDGSPLQAWCFFIGFILFPLWWIASFSPIPKTRQVGGTDSEKAVTIDNPQVEHDARIWRIRCRIVAAVSFLTYIPFIILVAIFVPRR